MHVVWAVLLVLLCCPHPLCLCAHLVPPVSHPHVHRPPLSPVPVARVLHPHLCSLRALCQCPTCRGGTSPSDDKNSDLAGTKAHLRTAGGVRGPVVGSGRGRRSRSLSADNFCPHWSSGFFICDAWSWEENRATPWRCAGPSGRGLGAERVSPEAVRCLPIQTTLVWTEHGKTRYSPAWVTPRYA